ncbi:MAG: hypothetical protein D6736_06010 [Nitrospinota bacterium]|nr:MAG: hypothetical protein D6736_06010 [Nitrospinota bacterium]
MTRYHGGERVKAGYYWNISRWEIVTVPPPGGVLPGEHASYLRLPLLLVALFAPLIGGLYVIFLPFIGFAMLLSFAAKELFSLVHRLVSRLLTKPDTVEE